MGYGYRMSGTIPLRALPGLGAAVDALRAEISDRNCQLELVEPPRTSSVPELLIESDTDSFHTYERIQKAIPEFAAKWASDPTVIDYWEGAENDRESWIVGPEGFDETAFRISLIDNQLAQLRIERERLVESLVEKAADAGESIEEYLCGVLYGHDFPKVEEHERCLCSRCGKDGDA